MSGRAPMAQGSTDPTMDANYRRSRPTTPVEYGTDTFAPIPLPVPTPSQSQFSQESPLKVRKTRRQRASEGDDPPPLPDTVTRTSEGDLDGVEYQDAYHRSRSRSILLAHSATTLSRRSFESKYDRNDPFLAKHESAPSVASSATLKSPSLIPKRKMSKRRVFTKVMSGLNSKGKAPATKRNGQSDGSLMRRWSLRSTSSSASRSKSSEISSVPAVVLTPCKEVTNAGNGDVTPRPLLSPFGKPVGGKRGPYPFHDHSENGPEGYSDSTGSLVRHPLQPQDSDSKSVLEASVIPTPLPSFTSPLLKLGFNVVPEFESVSVNDERSIWVALDIRSQLSTTLGSPSESTLENNMDIVVIIDNSQYASPTCIRSTCQIVRHLMSLLQKTDRFALFSTSCCHSLSHQEEIIGCQLHAIRRLKPELCETELSKVEAAAQLYDRRPATLSDTVTSVITYLTEGSPRKNALRIDCAHMFILSPSSSGALKDLSEYSPIQFHYICPSLVGTMPGQKPADVRPFFSYLHCPTENHHLPQGPSDGFKDTVKAVLDAARSRQSPGEITDLQIDIIPTRSCHIQTVLGQRYCSLLRPGQIHPLLVQVKVFKFGFKRRIRSSEPVKPHLQNKQLGKAFEDLESLLDIAETELFHVETRHRHSLFPDNTELVTSEAFGIRRRNPLTTWGDPEQKQKPAVLPNSETQKWLAYFVTTLYEPKAALSKLDEHFVKIRINEKTVRFLDVLREELGYRIDHNIGFEPEHLRLLKDKDSSPSHPRFSFENRNTALRILLPMTSLSPLIPSPPSSRPSSGDDAERKANSPSPLRLAALSKENVSISEYPLHSSSEEPGDKAQHIWRHMRKDSRSNRQLTQKKLLNIPEEVDENLREIRKTALANKRSVGADTLRSLAINVQGSMEAPWL